MHLRFHLRIGIDDPERDVTVLEIFGSHTGRNQGTMGEVCRRPERSLSSTPFPALKRKCVSKACVQDNVLLLYSGAHNGGVLRVRTPPIALDIFFDCRSLQRARTLRQSGFGPPHNAGAYVTPLHILEPQSVSLNIHINQHENFEPRRPLAPLHGEEVEGRKVRSGYLPFRTNAGTLPITPKRSSSLDVGTSSYRYHTATQGRSGIRTRTVDSITLSTSTLRNCGGGDRGRVAIYRPFGEVSLSLNRTVTCMVLKANDRRTSCPCHDEFRGPRSDYVRQTACLLTFGITSTGYTKAMNHSASDDDVADFPREMISQSAGMVEEVSVHFFEAGVFRAL
ncbi:uncharacterized protein TNCV_2305941 [Trichonephila clavipes]|nr:uncharacterized protein TNCV_2305941 [Trichonephila clavipes]